MTAVTACIPLRDHVALQARLRDNSLFKDLPRGFGKRFLQLMDCMCSLSPYREDSASGLPAINPVTCRKMRVAHIIDPNKTRQGYARKRILKPAGYFFVGPETSGAIKMGRLQGSVLR